MLIIYKIILFKICLTKPDSRLVTEDICFVAYTIFISNAATITEWLTLEYLTVITNHNRWLIFNNNTEPSFEEMFIVYTYLLITNDLYTYTFMNAIYCIGLN